MDSGSALRASRNDIRAVARGGMKQQKKGRRTGPEGVLGIEPYAELN